MESQALETIAAVASAPGEGAVGVIRLSGFGAIAVVESVFRSLHGAVRLSDAPARRLFHGAVVDPESGEVLDEVLVWIARAPHSYTGEDTAELFGHGGQVVLGEVLAALVGAGARPALPGEFTERAFLNGRVDLSQAESVVDLVRAKTGEARRAAVAGVLGGLKDRVESTKRVLVAVLAQLEAGLDFPEEEVPPVEWEDVAGDLQEARGSVAGLLSGAKRGRLLREGLRVVLAGRPNVGKSSLLNALVGRERAIVTEVPGTTRDVLEEEVNFGGVPVCLVDTAGLRAVLDEVEREGVRRARREVEGAGVALLVLDGAAELGPEDRAAAAALGEAPAVVVVNKSDCAPILGASEAEALLPGCEVVRVSARTRAGLGELETAALRAAGVGRQSVHGGRVVAAGVEGRQDVLVTRARQEEALRRAESELDAAVQESAGPRREELVAARIRRALHALGEITGESVDDEVLRTIFSSFCLGK